MSRFWRHQVLDRIKKTGSSNNKLQRKSKSKSKNVSPQQSIALIASIIIIIIAFGGLSLVYNVFAQNQSQNQNNLTTYENKELGFAFDYPNTWHNEYDAYEAHLNNVDIALADPFSNDTEGFEQTTFRVNVSDVRRSLGSDLQIRSDTPEDYMKNRINQENESLYQTSAHIKAATEYEESDEPRYTLDNLRDTTTLLIGGENASKVQYVIINSEGEQLQFSIHIYVVKLI